jgi:Spondin_N
VRSIRTLIVGTSATVLAALALAPTALAREYEVTITNLTSGQPLSPPVVATHHRNHAVFDVGEPASVGIREIAENGNNAPLLAFLAADPFDEFADFTETSTGPLVPPGTPGDAMFDQSATVLVEAGRRARRLSVATMLVCTNDGFTGVDGLKLPSKIGRAKTVGTNGYDAFTELNTEDYANMVPPCQALIGDSSGEPGTGSSDPALAEGGVITHHAGIQGGADLKPEIHGWTNPVAEIRVKRVG